LLIRLTEAGIGIVYAVLYALRMNGVRRSTETRCIRSVLLERFGIRNEVFEG